MILGQQWWMYQLIKFGHVFKIMNKPSFLGFKLRRFPMIESNSIQPIANNNVAIIPDIWIRVLTAMVKDCGHMVECQNVNRKRREIALPLRQERKKRKLQKLSVYDTIEQRSTWDFSAKTKDPEPLPVGFSFVNMSDDEVRIWYAIGAEIVDYSVLGCGIRKYVSAVWLGAEKELMKRKIDPEFFCDLRMS